MLITDKAAIGKKLLCERKRVGLTQKELADAAGISGRTYAALERGEGDIHLQTLLRICTALKITPDILLTTDEGSTALRLQVLLNQLQCCEPREMETAIKLLEIYLESVRV